MGEVGRLKGEHHDLREALAELERMLEPGQNASPELLAGRLASFLSELREHFAFEENGRLFADIAAQRATFDREVTRLMRQHGAILTSFASVHQLAEDGQPVGSIVQPLRKAMRLLLGHERAEMDLLQEAALTDLGGGD